jgi:hypothetical protein
MARNTSSVFRCSDHVTNAVVNQHRVRISDRIIYETTILVYRAHDGTVPQYLNGGLLKVTDMPSRRRLRSFTSNQSSVPLHHLTIGARSFLVVGLMA